MISHVLVYFVPKAFVTLLTIWLFLIPIALALYMVYVSVQICEAISGWVWRYFKQVDEK